MLWDVGLQQGVAGEMPDEPDTLLSKNTGQHLFIFLSCVSTPFRTLVYVMQIKDFLQFTGSCVKAVCQGIILPQMCSCLMRLQSLSGFCRGFFWSFLITTLAGY